MLHGVQLLNFEICRECNLAVNHKGLCPSGAPTRYGLLPLGGPLPDHIITASIKEAYDMMRFEGLVGFHYYNEPTLALPRIGRILREAKKCTPQARFLLWTNGSNPLSESERSLFDRIVVSDYTGDTPPLDNRMEPWRGRPEVEGPCYRPLVEMVVDFYGNGHLCCADWEGEIPLGNVRHHGFMSVASAHARWRRMVLHGEGPEKCRKCPIRMASPAGRIA